MAEKEKGPWTRRLVLKGIVITGAVLTAGVALRQSRRYPQNPGEFKILGPMLAAVLTALGDTLYPEGQELPSARDAGFLFYFDELLANAPPPERKRMEAMVVVFEHGTTPFGLRTKRFTDLDREGREAYLRHWEESSLYTRRMVADGLKVTAGMAYYSSPEVQKAMGMWSLCPSPSDLKAEPA